MRGGWRTFYFNDIETGRQIGSAIVTELKSASADFDPTDTTPAQVSIYFDIQLDPNPLMGSILCPIGTKRNSVIVKYNSMSGIINIIILGIDAFTYHSFDTREFIGTKQLTFADASYSEEYNYSVLHEDAFSPVGNLVLIHYPQHNLPHNTADSSVDEDYCTVVLVNQKYGQLTESMANYKFKTYGKLCGNNKIVWSRDTITVMCHAGRLVFNLTSGESEFVTEGIQNVNLHFKNFSCVFRKGW